MSLFTRRAIGIDIDASSIEVIEVERTSSGMEIVRASRVLLPKGLVEDGLPKDAKKLSLALKTAFTEAKPDAIVGRDVFVTLSDELTYTVHLELPYNVGDSVEDREAQIVLELLKNIPAKSEDIVYDYHITRTKGSFMSVLCVAALREDVKQWSAFFRTAGLRVSIFDIELLAQFRALFEKHQKEPFLIIDIGNSKTSFGLFTEIGFEHSHSFAYGGIDITTALVDALKITPTKANDAKRKKGVLDTNSKTASPIIKSLEPIEEKIRETMEYYSRDKQISVEKVFLTGGTSNLDGIIKYFSDNLGVSVVQGTVSKTFVGKATPKTVSHPANRVVYTEAIGAAIFGIVGSRPGELKINLEKKFFREGTIKPHVQEATEDSLKSKADQNNQIGSSSNNQSSHSLFKLFARLKPDHINAKEVVEFIALLIIIVGGVFLVIWYQGKREAENQKVIENRLLNVQESIINYAKEQGATISDLNETAIAPINESAATPILRLQILETPTGWLNVRSGPSVGSAQVGRVYTGEEYVIIQNESGWYQIDVGDATLGWVIGRYIEVLTETP
ncbi:MAG: pilus assembly protein PilM [bacterium]|nr:pilus assembly protein PilM [bacterium]